ncbi:nonstructural protein [Blackfly microvirus SF02]|uniref:Nonstructural protein n=1 Tax=Blackfly microvirus SF02 TaxID=2576452 RepID=A0A4P8PJZ6_9VIRU|nr:nonstructural protein [Blackfly microvirus SF02]
MAKLLLCTVFDSKVGSFAPTFCCKSRGEAIRSFEDAVRDPKMPFAAHPADYALFAVGEFDDLSGDIGVTRPDRLIGADEFS